MGELRSAARVLLRSPGFTCAAAALLAIGIGANAVVFGAFDALLLRPLAAPHPEQLVRMVQHIPRLGTRPMLPASLLETLQQRSQTLSAVFGEYPIQVAMSVPAPAEEVQVRMVTPEYFDVLGVHAIHGRTLVRADGDEREGAPPAVLSYGFWRNRFAADPNVVGRQITLHGHAFVVAGVLPREFNGTSIDTAPDIRVPFRAYSLLDIYGFHAEQRSLELSGRMKPGVSLEQAQAEFQVIWRSAEEARLRALPQYQKDPGLIQDELRDTPVMEPLLHGVSVLRDRFRPALLLLIASVALLQLLVCANLGGILLARGAARRGEMAVRLAVGASRARLVRQILAETALLTALGAAGGWLIANVCAPLLVRGLPPIRDLGTTRLALTLDIQPDRRVLLFSLAAAALTALLAGIVPAIAASRASLESLLRSARASHGWRGRQALLVLQMGLCTLLLAGAALLVRTFAHLNGTDLGFSRGHVVTFTANPSLSGYKPVQAGALRKALMERVRQLPGVVSVAAASRGLMRGSGVKTTVARPGHTTTQADFLNASFNNVSADYFDTMGMRILEGRAFRETDDPRGIPTAAVVSETFARRFFPSEDPVGQRFGIGQGPAGEGFEIVGMVNDARYRSLREPMQAVFFSPIGDDDFVLCVRTSGRAEAIMQPVRQTLASLDPALPFVEVHTMADEVDASAAPERLTATLASLFAGFAALLASVGFYGFLAFAVAERRREIGIRVALGASPRAVAGLIGRQAAVLVTAGVVLGLAAARLAAPVARALLYGVEPADWTSFASAGIVVVVLAAAATLIPALRAASTDPAVALRVE